ncbi:MULTISPECIES: hypothetical protein [unclassified Pseudomonas]|uniref:hypothetical protein n=1 Tax=unclassified Pseudomonas TaxID=196821 RepID=UPI000D6F1A0D|nr:MULTISPECIES: hypothetical protein [unclassified Pseudomonas]PWU31607.1 hypothetical protein DK254_03785 [Pseudomonas sp. RW407]
MSSKNTIVQKPRPGPVAEHDDPPKAPVRERRGEPRRPGPVIETPEEDADDSGDPCASTPEYEPDDVDIQGIGDEKRPG